MSGLRGGRRPQKTASDISALQRKGARRISDIDAKLLEQLNTGRRASATLVEALAMDLAALLSCVAPRADSSLVVNAKGFLSKMKVAGEALSKAMGPQVVSLATHPSDSVRGFVCFAIAAQEALSLKKLLSALKPFADDEHFGVREWAWMALRPRLQTQLEEAVELLAPWTLSTSFRLRRFATEATRPRGVWCRHLPLLKKHPKLGLPLLAPLRADATSYVQDSVANWLNDASKDNPAWVKQLCRQWLKESPAAATKRICIRAQRSL